MSICYKYLPPERISYLSDELLRFTQPGELNDPFECLPFVQAPEIGTVDPKYLENTNLQDAFLEGLQMNIASLGIFSLSKRWDSSLMWAHYTNSHSGFCIGFNPSHKFFSKQPGDRLDLGNIEKVDYAENRLTVQINKAPKNNIRLFYKKSLDWQYEEEVRLVRELKNSDAEITKSPFRLHLFKVPHTAVCEIISGVNASPNLEAALADFAGKNNLPLFQALISRKTFDMERKSVAYPAPPTR